MTQISHIDVHAHFVPDDYRQAIIAASGSDSDHFPMVPWNLDGHLANMAAHGIDVSILSISDPGVRMLPSGAAANELARSANEAARSIIQSHPRSFGAFATLPLPDVAAAIDEADDALDRLGLDGVSLLTNYDGVYLGDSRFDALLARLNQRHAVVFVHPTDPPGFRQLSLGLWSPVLEFPFDTTRCIASMLLAAVPQRFPNIRFIFSHGGGTLPFLAARLVPFVAEKQELVDRATAIAKVQSQLASFFYDLAAATSPAALAAISQFVPVSQLMLGFDYPFMPPATIAPALAALDQFEGWSATERLRVYQGTALSLFPGIALRTGAGSDAGPAVPSPGVKLPVRA